MRLIDELLRYRATLQRIVDTRMPGVWYRNWAKKSLALSECKGWVEDPSNPGLCINCGDWIEAHR